MTQFGFRPHATPYEVEAVTLQLAPDEYDIRVLIFDEENSNTVAHCLPGLPA
jgi:hypothetical protein